MTETPAKPANKRARSPKPKTKRPNPNHDEISERAYFIHLQEGACHQLKTGFVPSAN